MYVHIFRMAQMGAEWFFVEITFFGTHFSFYKNQVYKNHQGSSSQKLRISGEWCWGSVFRHPKNNSFKHSKFLKMFTSAIFFFNDSFSLKTIVKNNFFGGSNKVIEWNFKNRLKNFETQNTDFLRINRLKRNYLILVKKRCTLKIEKVGARKLFFDPEKNWKPGQELCPVSETQSSTHATRYTKLYNILRKMQLDFRVSECQVVKTFITDKS